MGDEPSAFTSVARDPSLVDKVSGELTEAIVSGRLGRGDRLPPERELGTQFGVSRTVIREAIRALTARGLVRVTSGRGVEVAGADAESAVESLRLFIRGTRSFNYPQVHEVRSTIEVQTTGLAAEHATPADISLLDELCLSHRRALDDADYLAASGIDFEFHRALVLATGNELFLVMLDSIGDVLREARDRAYPKPGVGELGLREHLEILEQVKAKDVAGSREAMRKHLAQADAIWLDEGLVG
jgi:DNA-binding FadR family transcriptional regulator